MTKTKITTTAAERIAELAQRAQQKARKFDRARRDRRFRAAVGAFAHARLVENNLGIEAVPGPVALSDVLWAGKYEPRLLELLPAVMIKKPAMIEIDRMPKDLQLVLNALRRNEVPTEFRGIPGPELAQWVPRVGHKNKLPTRLKAFRLRKDDLDLLGSLAESKGMTETDVVRAGLRALAGG